MAWLNFFGLKKASKKSRKTTSKKSRKTASKKSVKAASKKSRKTTSKKSRKTASKKSVKANSYSSDFESYEMAPTHWEITNIECHFEQETGIAKICLIEAELNGSYGSFGFLSMHFHNKYEQFESRGDNVWIMDGWLDQENEDRITIKMNENTKKNFNSKKVLDKFTLSKDLEIDIESYTFDNEIAINSFGSFIERDASHPPIGYTYNSEYDEYKDNDLTFKFGRLSNNEITNNKKVLLETKKLLSTFGLTLTI
jgi:hypothetical protein